MNRKKQRRDPAYIREQGKRDAKKNEKRNISFSLTKLIITQGETIEQWDELGLLPELFLRFKYLGQFSVQKAIQEGFITQYNKVSFPLNSGFTMPKHIIDVIWTVMHLRNKSKEVVVGYIEDDIFFVVFLDKEHNFWPSNLKNT